MTDHEMLARMLAARRIAVVGLSDDPSKASHRVASYLQSVGKEIVPVNPNLTEVLGEKCYARLEDIPGHVDLVDVFRLPKFCEAITASAIAIGAGGVWLQSGIRSESARKLAEAAGVDYVEDRCLMIDLARSG